MRITLPELTIERHALEPDVWFIRRRGKYLGVICKTFEGRYAAAWRGQVIGQADSVNMAALLFRDKVAL